MRSTKLKKIQKGEQNRYGEIEYELSDSERIQGLKEVLESSNQTPFTKEESETLQSIIYWNLCDNIGVVDETCKIASQFYRIAPVREGILEGFQKRFTMSSRVNHLENLFYSFQKLRLPMDELKKDTKEMVEEWRTEKDWDRFSMKVEDLLNR